MLRHVVVIDLSDASCKVTRIAKELRHRFHIRDMLANVNGIAMNKRLIGIETGHERGTAWPTKRILTVGLIKADTAGCQSINVGCLDQRMPVAADVAVQIVTDQEQNVRSVGGIGMCGGGTDD